MPVLNFKEIPEAHIATGEQDRFELFAAEFLVMKGYEIVEGPGRGSDLGKDLVILERRKGIGRETLVRWLVSCKHKAHSGRSVGLEDETNLVERVEGHECQGVIAFYSTLPSASLVSRLNQLTAKFEHQAFDHERIERDLLASPAGLVLAERFFPESLQSWLRENPQRAQVFGDNEPIPCVNCGRDLLNPLQGVYTVWRSIEETEGTGSDFVDMYCACKGNCDRSAKASIQATHGRRICDAWDDISELAIPVIFIQKIMAYMNGTQRGDKWSDVAFTKFKKLLLAIYPYVVRNTTTAERERLKDLQRIPAFLGGLNFEDQSRMESWPSES